MAVTSIYGSGKCCCFECKKRTMTCHASCEEYKEYLKSNEERRRANLDKRLAEQGYSEHVAGTILRARRKRK